MQIYLAITKKRDTIHTDVLPFSNQLKCQFYGSFYKYSYKFQICFKCSKVGSDMILNISFIGRPDVKVQGKPVNPYQVSYGHLIILKVKEKVKVRFA